MNGIMMIV